MNYHGKDPWTHTPAREVNAHTCNKMWACSFTTRTRACVHQNIMDSTTLHRKLRKRGTEEERVHEYNKVSV